jgi:hypothetical protein
MLHVRRRLIASSRDLISAWRLAMLGSTRTARSLPLSFERSSSQSMTPRPACGDS